MLQGRQEAVERGPGEGGGGSFLVREFSFESGKIDVLRENRGKLKL